MTKNNIIICIVCLFVLTPLVLEAEEKGSVTNLPLPRFISLKASEVNIRSGPAYQYPVKSIYKCKNYPIQIIAEFNNWRMLRDHNGSQGWIHNSLISGKRYALVVGNYVSKKLPYAIPYKESILFKSQREESYPIARIEVGSILKIIKCTEKWCKVEIDKYRGWIKKINLWGVSDNEIIKK